MSEKQKITQKELQGILDSHKSWLMGDEGKRADLQDADLQGAHLQGANLRGANLQDANLQGAHLRGADLYGANFDFSCWPLRYGG